MLLFILLVSMTGKKRCILKGIVRYTLNGKNGCILSLSGVERCILSIRSVLIWSRCIPSLLPFLTIFT